MRIFVLCTLLGAVSEGALAQNHPYRHFTVDNGLVSNVVYAAYCDSIGQIWFGTDNGVQVFDGFRFRDYFGSDISEDNEVFEIYEDLHGNIWFSSMYGSQYRIERDTVLPYEHNALLNELADKFKEIKKPVHSANGGINFSGNKLGFVQVGQDGSYSNTPFDHYTFLEEEGEVFFCNGPNTRDSIIRFLVRENPRDLKYPKDAGLSLSYWLRTSEMDYLCMGARLFQIGGTTIEKREFENRIIDISEDREGRVWVGLLDGGAVCLDEVLNTEGLDFLSKQSITKVVQDHEGGYWFTTLYNGIFHVPDIGIRNFEFIKRGNNKIVSLDVYRSALFATHEKGDVYQVSPSIGFEGNLFNASKEKVQQVRAVFTSEGDFWAAVSNSNVISLSGNKMESEEATFRVEIEGAPYTSHGFLNDIGDGLSEGYGTVVNLGHKVEFPLYRIPELGIYNKVCISQGQVFIAATHGAVVQDEQGIREVPMLSGIAVNDVLRVSDRFYWATENLGVLITSAQDTTWLNEKNGLPSVDINRLYNDGDSILWIASDGGVSLYDIAKGEVRLSRSYSSGLANDRVSAMYADSKEVYIGTFSGLSVLKRSGLKTSPRPALKITGTDIRNSGTSKNGLLTGGKADARFDFQQVSMTTTSRSFKYRLVGFSETWDRTEDNTVVFRSLEPGRYVFQVGMDRLDSEDERYQEFSFEIPKHWSDTWWFRLLCALIVFYCVALITSRIKHRAVQRERSANALAYYREQTIRSRMDPHFIFNSLNSLQYYLVSEQNSKASKYLTSLAKLLRKNIEYSRDDLISVKDELALLRSYCELESMRFEGQLDYEINTDSRIDEEGTFMPAMILQPLIENAVWHGLNGKDGEKWVKVAFEKKDNRLVVHVRDNGKGVQRTVRAVKRQNKQHASEMIQKRLKLYCKIFRKDFTFRRLDNNSSNEQYPGTHCEVTLPIVKSKELALNELNET